jgi:hypothetical protein
VATPTRGARFDGFSAPKVSANFGAPEAFPRPSDVCSGSRSWRRGGRCGAFCFLFVAALEPRPLGGFIGSWSMTVSTTPPPPRSDFPLTRAAVPTPAPSSYRFSRSAGPLIRASVAEFPGDLSSQLLSTVPSRAVLDRPGWKGLFEVRKRDTEPHRADAFPFRSPVPPRVHAPIRPGCPPAGKANQPTGRAPGVANRHPRQGPSGPGESGGVFGRLSKPATRCPYPSPRAAAHGSRWPAPAPAVHLHPTQKPCFPLPSQSHPLLPNFSLEVGLDKSSTRTLQLPDHFQHAAVPSGA